MAATMEEATCEGTATQEVPHPFYIHPKIQEMRSYGYSNEEQLKQTLLVYLDLLEAKHWWDVRIVPCAGLQQPLVCGQPGQRELLEVILPLRHDNELSVCDLQNVLAKVKAEYDCKGITLGLMDSESTIVYYKISDGFLPPEPPESLQEKKKERQRKMQKRRTKYIHLPHNADNVRARYMGHGPSTSNPAPNLGLVETRIPDISKVGEDETDMFPTLDMRGTSKRSMDCVSSQESLDGAKLRKLDDGRSVPIQLDEDAVPSGSQAALVGIPGTSFGLASDQQQHAGQENFFPGNKEAGSANASGGAMNLGAPDGEVPMAQAPGAKNDSDHDSGMDAGDDEEDEGFGEEL